MESSHPLKRKNQLGDSLVQKLHSSPSNIKHTVESDEEFSLYQLHKESSPNFRAGQDVLEVGWGDSPEPLNMEERIESNNFSLKCKKKLEIKESPKSSIPFKRRFTQSTFSLPPNADIDVAKYVAEVQELSKNIMKDLNAETISINKDLENNLCVNDQLIKNELNSCKPSVDGSLFKSGQTSFNNNECCKENKDVAFDSLLQTFINEEDDDWLSQAMPMQESLKIYPKGSFVKSKSENELGVPPSLDFSKKNSTQSRNVNNNFRRASSFDVTKSQNHSTLKVIHESKKSSDYEQLSNQYSLQEIERKRLEAKYRKERREIERKKLEAIKKLEMKKLKPIKT